MADSARIDVWLFNVRFYKSRSLAADAVQGGLVHLNGARVKPDGTVLDPAGPMITYVRGVTKRSAYKNPEMDRLLDEQGRTFDEKKRCELLRQANQLVLDDVPMLMMWSHEVVTGVRDNIDVYVAPNSEVWHPDTRVN